jgi:hypothetical protein
VTAAAAPAPAPGEVRGAHALVDRHFAGGGAAAARMFRHLRRCESCRARYRAHALLETLAPDGEVRARDRLAGELFGGATAAAAAPGWLAWLRRRFWLAGLGTALAAGAAALVLVAIRTPGESAHFGARGIPAAGVAPALVLYRVAAGGPAERAGAVVKAGEALVFSYVNPPSGAARAPSHLLVFAHDDQRRVFWYWPAWQDPAANPAALPIGASAAPVELGEAIRHPLSPGPLTVVGLFSDRPITVREVEATLAARGPDGLAALGGQLWTERVEVLP